MRKWLTDEESFTKTYAAKRREFGVLYFLLWLKIALVKKHLRENSRVLDVGAADGAMMAALSQRMQFALTVDLDPKLALVALSSGPAVCSAAPELPFKDNSFDFVVCTGTRKQIKDTFRLSQEIARVLRPGGRAVIVDPHPFTLRVGQLVGKFDKQYLRHYSSASEIMQELQANKLRPVYQRSHMFVCCVAEKPPA